nr:nitrogenase component 1 [Methanothermobacter thermautotrophicus]
MGEFNVAGDLWEIKRLLEEMGIEVVASITGDSTVAAISVAHTARLNLVQCSKSSGYLAEEMERRYGIPHINVNFFGIRETMDSLISISEFFGLESAESQIVRMAKETNREVARYRSVLEGKTVAIYVGGNKAWSLIRAFEDLGMDVIMSGTQNGIPEDYLKSLRNPAENLYYSTMPIPLNFQGC